MRQTSRREKDNILRVNITKMCQTLNWRASGSVKYIFKQKILCLFSLSFQVYQKATPLSTKTWKLATYSWRRMCSASVWCWREGNDRFAFSHGRIPPTLVLCYILRQSLLMCNAVEMFFCLLFSLIVSWLLMGSLEIHYGEIRLYQHHSNCRSYFAS